MMVFKNFADMVKFSTVYHSRSSTLFTKKIKGVKVELDGNKFNPIYAHISKNLIILCCEEGTVIYKVSTTHDKKHITEIDHIDLFTGKDSEK